MGQAKRASLGEPLLKMPLAPPNPADFIDDDASDPIDQKISSYSQGCRSEAKHGKDYTAIQRLFRGVVDPHLVVKSFVRLGVRGFELEAFTSKGGMQRMNFQMSRDVDSFRLTSSEVEYFCKVAFADISNIYIGDERCIQYELGESYRGLDSRSVVLELVNRNCLALRFGSVDWADNGEEAAEMFARCMQTFILTSRLHSPVL